MPITKIHNRLKLLLVALCQITLLVLAVMPNGVASADKPVVPAGCPGSGVAASQEVATLNKLSHANGGTTTETVAQYDKTVCDKNNPPGCPGSTHSAPHKPANKCPYQLPAKTPTTNTPPTGTSTSVDCSANDAYKTEPDCVCDSSNPNPPAICDNSDATCDTTNGGQCDIVGKYLNPGIKLLTVTFGLIATISVIIGGIGYATSEGDSQKAAKAKRRIANTIIAIVAYMFLYAFLQFIVPGGLFR